MMLLAILIDLSVKATAVLLLAAGAAVLWRRGSAAARHLIWTAGVAGLFVLPVLGMALPTWRVLPGWAQWSEGAVAAATPVVKVVPTAISQWPAPMESTGVNIPPGETVAVRSPGEATGPQSAAIAPEPAPAPAASSSAPLPAPASPSAPMSWEKQLVWAWAVGVVCMLLPLGVSWVALRGMARRGLGEAWEKLLGELCGAMGVGRRVRLVDGGRRTVPMTFGIWRPVIVVPANARGGWGEERRRIVLLHELAHIRRQDCLTMLLARVARAVLWFHPLVWVACARMGTEAERACDDLVLKAGTRSSAYASELLAIASGFQGQRALAAAALTMARTSTLETRLRGILDGKRNRRGLTRKSVLIGMVIAVCIIVPLAIMRGAAKAPAPIAKVTITWRADEHGQYNPDSEMIEKPRTLTLTDPEAIQRLAGYFPAMEEKKKFGPSETPAWGLEFAAFTFTRTDGTSICMRVDPRLSQFYSENYAQGRPVQGNLAAELAALPWARPTGEIAWGPAVEGVQLGIRTAKGGYTMGDTLAPEIWARNVTDQALTWQYLYHPQWSTRVNYTHDGGAGEITFYTTNVPDVPLGGTPKLVPTALEPGKEVKVWTLFLGASGLPARLAKAGKYTVGVDWTTEAKGRTEGPRYLSGKTEIVVAAPGAAGAIAWGEAANGIQTGIRVAKGRYAIGEWLGAEVWARNVTDQAVTWEFIEHPQFMPTVTLPKEENPGEMAYGWGGTKAMEKTERTLVLPAGKEVKVRDLPARVLCNSAAGVPDGLEATTGKYTVWSEGAGNVEKVNWVTGRTEIEVVAGAPNAAEAAVLEVLRKELNDPDTKVRVAAIEKLEFMGSKARSMIPTLMRMQFKEKDAVSLAAEGALEHMGAVGKESLPELLELVKDSNADLRSAAALRIGSLGADGKAAVPALVAALREDLLADFGWSRVDEALNAIGPEGAQAAYEALRPALKDSNERRRRWAAENIDARRALTDLVPLLADESSAVRSTTAIQIGLLGREGQAGAAGMAKLLKDPDAYVREKAAVALAQVGVMPAEVKATLPELYGSEDRTVRMAVAVCMARSGDVEPWVTRIAEVLAAVPADLAEANKFHEERSMGLEALRNLGPVNEKVLPALIAMLEREPDYYRRGSVADALASMGAGAKAALPALRALAKEPDGARLTPISGADHAQRRALAAIAAIEGAGATASQPTTVTTQAAGKMPALLTPTEERAEAVKRLVEKIRAAVPGDWKVESEAGEFTPTQWVKAGRGVELRITVPGVAGGATKIANGGPVVWRFWLMEPGYDEHSARPWPNGTMAQKNPAEEWGLWRGGQVVCEEMAVGKMREVLAPALAQTDTMSDRSSGEWQDWNRFINAFRQRATGTMRWVEYSGVLVDFKGQGGGVGEELRLISWPEPERPNGMYIWIMAPDFTSTPSKLSGDIAIERLGMWNGRPVFIAGSAWPKARDEVIAALAASEPPWGEVVDGMQLRLRPEKMVCTQWRRYVSNNGKVLELFDEIEKSLTLDVRNAKNESMVFSLDAEQFLLEIDGKVYGENGYSKTQSSELIDFDSHMLKSVKPGDSAAMDIPLSLLGGTPFEGFKPGVHTVRVILNGNKLVSNPVTIEILPEAPATGPTTKPGAGP